ncbi:hypothetical protein [Helicovermis profundi]|uniref:Uncharacterized protein n=1 Tax=Helicovermis profundi TaxID=3065157 RepID=A0AAU9E1B2_9FIRM|nr:hypothetical protein HLPR_05700 [Clostridia bacterium S502]
MIIITIILIDLIYSILLHFRKKEQNRNYRFIYLSLSYLVAIFLLITGYESILSGELPLVSMNIYVLIYLGTMKLKKSIYKKIINIFLLLAYLSSIAYEVIFIL